jgi:hypothetical protein
MANDVLTPFLESTQTVAIITTRTDGTEVATPIWSVATDDAGYVRSYLGPGAGWFKRAISGRPVSFSLESGALAERDPVAALDTRRVPVKVEVVAGDELVHEPISNEFLRKYARWPKDVAPMVVEPALQATLRVLPA